MVEGVTLNQLIRHTVERCGSLVKHFLDSSCAMINSSHHHNTTNDRALSIVIVQQLLEQHEFFDFKKKSCCDVQNHYAFSINLSLLSLKFILTKAKNYWCCSTSRTLGRTKQVGGILLVTAAGKSLTFWSG